MIHKIKKKSFKEYKKTQNIKSKKGGAIILEDDLGDLELFSCPISSTIFIDPVVAEDGFFYERESIEDWFKKSNISPITNKPIGKHLVPSYGLQKIIENISKKNKEFKDAVDISTPISELQKIEEKKLKNSKDPKSIIRDLELKTKKLELKIKEKENIINNQANYISSNVEQQQGVLGKILHISSVIAIKNDDIAFFKYIFERTINDDLMNYEKKYFINYLLKIDNIAYNLVFNESFEIFKYFVSLEDSIIDIVNKKTGWTPLIYAIKEHKNDFVTYILEKKDLVNLNRNFKKDVNYIHFAAFYGNTWALRQLLELNSKNINQKNTQGLTPIALAAKEGNVDVFDILRKYDADLNVVENNNHNIYELAAYNNKKEILEYALENKLEFSKERIIQLLEKIVNENSENQSENEKYLDIINLMKRHIQPKLEPRIWGIRRNPFLSKTRKKNSIKPKTVLKSPVDTIGTEETKEETKETPDLIYLESDSDESDSMSDDDNLDSKLNSNSFQNLDDELD